MDSNEFLYSLTTCKPFTSKEYESINWMDYLIEPKYDGWRMLSVCEDGIVKMYTRTFHRAEEKMPAIVQQLRQVGTTSRTVVDGEIIFLYDEDLSPDYNLTSRILGSGTKVALEKQNGLKGQLYYMLFDVLVYKGEDVRSLPYRERIKVLNYVVEEIWADKRLVTNTIARPILHEEMAAKYHQENIATWGEGSVLKLASSPYMGKRHKSWLKWKKTPTEDVVIMGFDEGKGKYEDMIGAVVFGQYKDGVLTVRGRCSGMTDEVRMSLDESFIGCVLEIATNGVLANGGFRHPQWKHLRDDKLAIDCGWT